MFTRGSHGTIVHRAWAIFATLGLLGTAAYVLVEDNLVRTVIVTVLSGSAVAAILAGIRIHRPAHCAPWFAFALVQALWFVGWFFWQASILETGAAPATDSPVNLIFLAAYVPLLAGLLLMLRRREGDLIAIVDAAILAVGAGTIAWELLLHAYVNLEGLPELGRAIQIGYALLDITVLAAIVRLAVSSGSRRAGLVLLLASPACFLLSQGIWNWSLQIGTYTVGSWGDSGWLLFAVFAGAAALHPSMRDVSVRAEELGRRLRWDRMALLVSAALVVPGLLLARTAAGIVLQEVALALGAAIITLLVITRLAVLVREEAHLSSRLTVQNEQLVELDRLKDDFVASVSHELRTPLTSIRGFLDLVLAGHEGDLNGGQRECLEIVHRNADRLQYLVGDLLFVAQVDAGKLALDVQDIELTAVVAESCRSAKPRAAEKDIALSFSGVERATVSGDPVRLAQLVDNLISNALKFTPVGGRVDVRVAAEDQWLRLEIADSGIGIPEAEQELLFDRFFRAAAASKNATQGTGLGLSISKAIIDAHGGRIEVESAEGIGTTFRVRLPAAAVQPERAIAETEAAA